jgi:hypothetical protein
MPIATIKMRHEMSHLDTLRSSTMIRYSSNDDLIES